MKISESAKTKQRHEKQLYHLIYQLLIVNKHINSSNASINKDAIKIQTITHNITFSCTRFVAF
jgi:hypothetical protein